MSWQKWVTIKRSASNENNRGIANNFSRHINNLVHYHFVHTYTLYQGQNVSGII